MFKKIFNNKKGTALLMTILILNSILIATLAASQLLVAGIKMSGTQEKSTKAYFAAESGGEQALWEWRKNGYVFPATDTDDVFSGTLSNNSSFSVDYASSSNDIIMFKSMGLFSDIKRSIEITLDFS